MTTALDQLTRIRSQTPVQSPRSPRPKPEPPPEVTDEEVANMVRGIRRITSLILREPIFQSRVADETRAKIGKLMKKPIHPLLKLEEDLFLKRQFPKSCPEVIYVLAMRSIQDLSRLSIKFFERLQPIEGNIKRDPSYQKTEAKDLIRQNSTLLKVLKKQEELAQEYFEKFSDIATAYFEAVTTFEESQRSRSFSLLEALTPRKSTPRTASHPNLGHGRSRSRADLEATQQLYDVLDS